MKPKMDFWVLAGWFFFALGVAAFRREFIGDGVRHVHFILENAHPLPGEPRWLLFPAFLFAWLKPLVLAGLIKNVESALRPFALASVAAGAFYLYSLRGLLAAHSLSVPARARALLAAGLCAAFLFLATDTVEPLFAAALCVMGLRRAAQDKIRTGVLCLAAATLLYQGMALALFLLPLATGWKPWKNPRRLFQAVLIFLAAPLLMLAVLLYAEQRTLPVALAQMLFGERNALFASWMRGGLFKGILVTSLAGLPQGLVYVPGMMGLRAILSGLQAHEGLAWMQLLRLGTGFVLVAGGLWQAVRQKRWEWLLALAGLAILPILRNQQYMYNKFYLLLPVLVGLTVARLPARTGISVGLALAIFNVPSLLAEVVKGRTRYAAYTSLYAKATPNTYWLTSGFVPPFSYRWPGRNCSMLMSLATDQKVLPERNAEFLDCLNRAFCEGDGVWTADWTVASEAKTVETARHFQFPAEVMKDTFWRGDQGPAPALPFGDIAVVYSAAQQRRACKGLGLIKE